MQKLIKIKEDHYVVVDDSKIEVDDWYIEDAKQIRKFVVSDEVYWQYRPYDREYKKITHSTQPLELLSENGLSGMGFSKVRPLNIFEVKELIGEVDLEILAANLANPNVCKTTNWIEGYNQALEDNKEKKYTEKDINKIRQILVEGAITNMSCSSAVVELDKYIQSLQLKTKWEVEIVDGKLKLK
jgi:hypothetical protein